MSRKGNVDYDYGEKIQLRFPMHLRLYLIIIDFIMIAISTLIEYSVNTDVIGDFHIHFTSLVVWYCVEGTSQTLPYVLCAGEVSFAIF